MEKNPALGVRKGAWTKEEDMLLRECIEKYGEGKWHLVPLRAGLNRCRKICRLRWLNYLRPNLKRGYFNRDEVDLILRLHKLVGNRWSLIAGRLPGRTAKDVKNFWNTHIEKKTTATGESSMAAAKIITDSNIIIRPRPRTFSKSTIPVCPSEAKTNEPNDENPNSEKPSSLNFPTGDDDENPKKKKPSLSESLPQEERNYYGENGDENPKNEKHISSSSSPQEEVDECIRWWGKLLEISENGEGTPFSLPDEDQ